MSTFDFSRGRGVLAMTKFVPLRRPGQVTSRPDQSSSNRQEQAPGRQPGSRPAGNNTGRWWPISTLHPNLTVYEEVAEGNREDQNVRNLSDWLDVCLGFYQRK